MGEHQKSSFWGIQNENFHEIFFQAIEFYHTVILLLESRETLYTARRKVYIGPMASPLKMGPKLKETLQ